MTLIPLISAIMTAPEATTAPAGGVMLRRESYDPGAGHRPVAALIAFGLPLALVTAVALSPMIVRPPTITETPPWIDITLPKPKPPEVKPEAKPQSKQRQTSVTSVPQSLPPVASGPVEVTVQPPNSPPSGTGTGPAIIADPPLPPTKPPLVLAELDPRFAGSFQPDYPASEQRRGMEGVAKVRVLIGTDGRVKAVELVSSDSPGFFEETRRRALSKWRFKPATRGGVAEESWKLMTVRFQIHNS